MFPYVRGGSVASIFLEVPNAFKSAHLIATEALGHRSWGSIFGTPGAVPIIMTYFAATQLITWIYCGRFCLVLVLGISGRVSGRFLSPFKDGSVASIFLELENANLAALFIAAEALGWQAWGSIYGTPGAVPIITTYFAATELITWIYCGRFCLVLVLGIGAGQWALYLLSSRRTLIRPKRFLPHKVLPCYSEHNSQPQLLTHLMPVQTF